jgi:hypothetical protein
MSGPLYVASENSNTYIMSMLAGERPEWLVSVQSVLVELLLVAWFWDNMIIAHL